MAINEFAFSVDDFQNPKVFKDAEAISTLLIRLLLLEPGTIQSHPDMGVGIVSRYRYSTEDEAMDLQSDFQKQIELFLPQFQGVRVSVSVKNKTFMIAIEIDGALFGIYYDTETSNIQSNYTKLSEL